MSKTKMSNSPVEIICILDRSGSMYSLAPEVIGSFNNFVVEQIAEEGQANLTLVLFDNKYEVVYDSVPLNEVPKLTEDVYFARGMTGMYDAIGKAVSSCTAKDAMVLIQTDGFENSSTEYTKDSIKSLIKEKEDIGWDFIFLGANMDAADEGQKFGMSLDKSISFDASSNGITAAYASMSNATTTYRKSKI